MTEVTVAVVYHSKYGHTKLQAEAVAEGARNAGAAKVLIMDVEVAKERLTQLDQADAIIFGCPTFMGNISAGMKDFLEDAVGRWFNRAWQDKIAGGFTTSSNFSGDKNNTLTGLMIAAMQWGMIWVGMGEIIHCENEDELVIPYGPGPESINRVSSSIGAMGATFKLEPPELLGPGDIKTAMDYGQRIAEITVRFNRGKQK